MAGRLGFIQLLTLLLCVAAVHGAELPAPLAGQELRPGLLVDIACGDALADLAADGRFLVHGLARDDATVARVRAALARRGLAARASVERGDLTTLPYADRIVDVLVAEAPVDLAEVRRVLTPRGTAFLKDVDAAHAPAGSQQLAGGWIRFDQPLGAELDEWSHYLHDAGNSMASTDTAVGWPDQLRFVAGRPYAGSLGRWSSGFTSAGGRDFYASPVEPGDRAPAGALTLLEARNAYNGVLLWRRYFGHGPLRFHWSTVGYTVDADRVYVPYAGGLAALSAATGEDLWRVADADGTAMDSVQVADGVLVRNGRSLRAFAVDTGKQRWRMDLDKRGSSIALGDGHVFCAVFKEWATTAIELRCCDASDGKLRWTKPLEEGKEVFRTGGSFGLALQYRSGRLALTTPGKGGWAGMTAYVSSAADGALQWTTKSEANAPLIFRDDAVINQLTTCDPATGAVTTTVAERGKFAGNCGRTFASASFFLGGRLGFMDRATGEARYYQLTSGGCTLGAAYPANGLANFTRQTCTCYTMLQGHLAFAATPAGSADRTVADAARIEAGPALGQVTASAPIDGSWPTFRHDALRSGGSAMAMPGSFSIEWQARVGGKPTAPVSDGINAYLAVADEQRVVAIRLGDGAQQWSFTAGGPIDSPPTLSDGYAVFGCRDGWVYALRAADGALAWRHLVAPSDRRIVAFEHLESSWPVIGSVLIRDGMVYALAGRHSQVDGGMWLVGLRLDSGAAAWRQRIGLDRPDARLALVNDVLRSDGLRLYITAFGQFTGQDKYAYDFTTGARVTMTQNGKTPCGPLLSADDGMLIDGRERIAIAISHTEMRRIWYYAPDRNLSGKGYPGVTNQQIPMNPANGYRGDLIAFAADRVAGCARTYPADTDFPDFISGQERPVIYGTSTLARAPWAFDPRRSAFDLRALVMSADKIHVAFAGSDPAKPDAQLLTLDGETGELLSSLPLPAAPRWDGMMITDGRLLLTTEDGQLISLWQPARGAARGWSVPAGASTKRDLELGPHALLPLPLEVRWRYQLDGATIGEGRQSWTVRDQIPERMPITLPAATPAGDGGTATLTVESWSGAVMRSREERAVRLVKEAPARSDAAQRPFVWDPSGAVQRRLQARGLGFTETTEPWAVPPGATQLIVGANSLGAEHAQDARWRTLIEGGCRVLMLEQRLPVAAAAIGLDFTTVDGSERGARLVAGPAVAGLVDADLRCWPGDGLLAERSVLPGKARLRPLVRSADGRRLLVVDLLLGDGRLIVSHLALGAGLQRDDAVCRRLFDNLVDGNAAYLPVHAASALDPASPTGRLLAETGLASIAAPDVLASMAAPTVNLVVAEATPELLARLVGAADQVQRFTARGGWLLLCGLRPEGGEPFSRLVGYDHLIRPWEPARISLPGRADPLVAGITADDLQLRSALRLDNAWVPAADVWTAVPDGDDLAPFCALPGAAWGSPNAALGSDRYPRNLVNGFSTADSWRLSFSMPIDAKGAKPIELRLPSPRRISGFAILPGTIYRTLTSLRLVFDDHADDAITVAVRPVAERQEVTFPAPREAQTVRVELLDWTKTIDNPTIMIDNLWLYAERSAEQRRDMRPLTEPAVLMAYPRARGGILLDQLRAIAPSEIEAAISPEERARLTENRAKQLRVLAILLWNLGARLDETRR